jgi:4-hydroxy-3-polyprenylbenzoate decarboxylase
MVIIPCSMSTLAGVASGLGNNLILRAADVTLKERRPLILVPRETPIGTIALENMLKAARAGACVLPAMPAFYQGPKSVDDMVDFVVGKVLNQLGVKHDLFGRWEGGA